MELCNGTTLSGSLSALVMEGEELRMPFTEELVERIIAMVPFPQIFKARALSKSWHTRLSLISSHGDDEEKKLLAGSFQKRVCEWSDKWNTFCPVFLFDDFLSAYDRESQQWRRLPFLAALPVRRATEVKALLDRHSMETSIIGALLFFTSSYPDITLVVNMFTGSWKRLPALPHTHRRHSTPGRLVSSKETYKVIRLHTEVGCACAWIYDSKLGGWRSKRLEMPEIREEFEVGLFDVYLNGFLYVTVHVEEPVWSFLAFNVEEETFSLIQMPPTRSLSVEWLQSRPLLACNDSVYIVEPKGLRSVILLEVDLVTRSWSQVVREPPPSIEFGCFSYEASSDGDCLFFHGTKRDKVTSNGKVVAYNVRKDEWSPVTTNPILQQSPSHTRYSCICSSACFQPGMNPFLVA